MSFCVLSLYGSTYRVEIFGDPQAAARLRRGNADIDVSAGGEQDANYEVLSGVFVLQ